MDDKIKGKHYESIIMDNLAKAQVDYLKYVEKKRNHAINYEVGPRFLEDAPRSFRYSDQVRLYAEALMHQYVVTSEPKLETRMNIERSTIANITEAVEHVTRGLSQLTDASIRLSNEEFRKLKIENEELRRTNANLCKDRDFYRMLSENLRTDCLKLERNNYNLTETILDLINHSPIK